MHSEIENRTLFEWIALRCQSGEADAFDDLVAAMERPLLYYATSLTGNSDNGLDVLQEVWIKAFRGIGKLKDPGALRSWLYSITHGIAVDRIRRNASRERAEAVELVRGARKHGRRQGVVESFLQNSKTFRRPASLHLPRRMQLRFIRR